MTTGVSRASYWWCVSNTQTQCLTVKWQLWIILSVWLSSVFIRIISFPVLCHNFNAASSSLLYLIVSVLQLKDGDAMLNGLMYICRFHFIILHVLLAVLSNTNILVILFVGLSCFRQQAGFIVKRREAIFLSVTRRYRIFVLYLSLLFMCAFLCVLFSILCYEYSCRKPFVLID